MSNVNKYIEVELNKLRDEIIWLKKCQVDFIRLATILFGLSASAMAALTPHLGIFEEPIKQLNLFLHMCVISVVVLVFPYIIWVIIHKCRSVFRIVAYIRFIENLYLVNKSDRNVNYYGYETLHRKVKEHPWLEGRVSSFDGTLSNVSRDLRTYKKWVGIMEKDKEFMRKEEFTSTNGLSDKGPYIGDYYGRLIFFVKLLWMIGLLSLVALSFYGFIHGNHLWKYIFIMITGAALLWGTYHYRLSRRHLTELRYRPFSIDAHYDMWQWAMREKEKELVRNSD